ncbi:hypothetical protein SHJG_1039 [Streptomyces hygroscopicus subsp. jinggangensis 5008]|nr:hypothetical protein SHJG_1039 [Streptomyces hygroscopicus subsp. jinggangensis 5008]AGF60538.1 hypothetical protein SHJGH_0872 [Streptomyces hygroscopicus subsp. jinggangensis TL01]
MSVPGPPAGESGKVLGASPCRSVPRPARRSALPQAYDPPYT